MAVQPQAMRACFCCLTHLADADRPPKQNAAGVDLRRKSSERAEATVHGGEKNNIYVNKLSTGSLMTTSGTDDARRAGTSGC
jgi:hypothetical protein